MPLVDNTHYVDSAGWSAVTAWSAGASIAAGALRRQSATPAAGNERVFVCIVAGTTHATTEPTWVVTRGAKTTDNTVTWQECTGLSAVNGDLTNTPNWTTIKNTAIVLGQIIKRDNGASYQICTTAGTAGNGAEPAFSDTAGTTTADNTVTWTSLGAVGNFTGGQAPHIRVANAIASTWAQAGNTIYLKNTHAYSTSASITWTGTATVASPYRFLCHNGGAYPPAAANLTTGATETSTAGSITVQSVAFYMEGITLAATTNAANITFGAVGAKNRFKNCTFVRQGTTGGITFSSTATGNMPHFLVEDCTFSFGNTGSIVSAAGGTCTWRNITLAGAAVPNTLIGLGASPSSVNFLAEGCDLSALGSGKTIVGALNSISGLYRFVNCKLGASVTKAGTPSTPSYRVEFINCNSGAVNYDTAVYDYTGTLTTEITVVRTGGASDGVTPISWRIDTTANAKFQHPFECPPITAWNDATGSSKTLTIQGIWGGGAVPNNDDIWVEVEYLGSSAQPDSTVISDAKATVLTTAAGQDAGTGTWGGSTTKFALAVSFTPQMKGPVIARVKAGAASQTFFVDPKITLT